MQLDASAWLATQLRALRTRLASQRRARVPTRTAASACPLWDAAFQALPGGALLGGALLALGLTAVFTAFDVAEGRWDRVFAGVEPWWSNVELRNAVASALLLVGILVNQRLEAAATTRDLAQLVPQLEPGAADGALGVPRRGLRAWGGLGALLVLAIVPTLYLDPGRFLHAATWRIPSVLFDLATGAVTGWGLFRTLYAAAVQDRAFARLARRLREIDLLDLRALRPFPRRGLRRALRWTVLASIGVFVFADAGRLVPPATLFAGIVAFAMVSFLLPVYGVHRSIRAEKERVLAGLRDAIRRERLRLMDGDGEAGGHAGHSGRLADLLAYEARIAAAREWPVDSTTLLRLAVFLLLPLGSWLGGALVEHLVDAFLG